MDKGTQELRLMHWAELVKECHNSGMKVREWCQQNDIDEKRYYYWQRKVRQEILQIQETSTTTVEKVTTFAQLPIPIGSESKSDFQPDVVLKRAEGADKILDYYRASEGAFLCIQKNKGILHYRYIIKQSQ